MRRFLITAAIVPSLLAVTVPANASAASNHRQKARGDAVKAHTTTSGTSRAQKFTWGRT